MAIIVQFMTEYKACRVVLRISVLLTITLAILLPLRPAVATIVATGDIIGDAGTATVSIEEGATIESAGTTIVEIGRGAIDAASNGHIDHLARREHKLPLVAEIDVAVSGAERQSGTRIIGGHQIDHQIL